MKDRESGAGTGKASRGEIAAPSDDWLADPLGEPRDSHLSGLHCCGHVEVDEFAVAFANDTVDPDRVHVPRLSGEHDLAVGDVGRAEVEIVGTQHDQVGFLALRQ